MVWRMVAGLLAVAGSLQGCAATPPPSLPVPVCAEPGVLRQLHETIRARGRPMVFDIPPVGETSTGPALRRGMPAGSDQSLDMAPLAHCAVRGHTVGYDTNRYGASPVHEPFIVRYTVEQRHNGLFVQVD